MRIKSITRLLPPCTLPPGGTVIDHPGPFTRRAFFYGIAGERLSAGQLAAVSPATGLIMSADYQQKRAHALRRPHKPRS